MESKAILLLGATGTIGRAVLRKSLAQGHIVVCPVRNRPKTGFDHPRLKLMVGDLTDPEFRASCTAGVGAVISCLTSRSGLPRDAWDVDFKLNHDFLKSAKATGVPRFILLSAICVQKPQLAFQHAKLAFETELKNSGLAFSIVRATAFFKSLAGQIERLRRGKPFLVFGDGRLTACKPISDGDLAEVLLQCLIDQGYENQVLNVGGPGPAITPLEQGQLLAEALGIELRVKKVPVVMMDVIVGVLTAVGWIVPAARRKAELARIGRYYATQSMLVWDKDTGRYQADMTPEYGAERLSDYYSQLASGDLTLDLGEHAVF